MLSKTIFIFLIGPTCIGKGFVVKLLLRILEVLTSMGLKVSVISFGQIIRDLMENNPDFKSRYGAAVARGELLDDPTAIELFNTELMKICAGGAPDIVIVDGFCRTMTQIEYAIQNGYLQAKDRVCIIEGTFETCLARFAHRKGMNTGRSETEIDTFRRRYHLHSDTVGDLRATFKETEAKLIDVDGNPDIAEFVFPNLASHLLPVFYKARAVFDSKNQDEVSSRS